MIRSSFMIATMRIPFTIRSCRVVGPIQKRDLLKLLGRLGKEPKEPEVDLGIIRVHKEIFV